MMEARHSRERMEKSLDEVKECVAEIKPVVTVVAEMRPQVKELMEFKMRIGAYVVVAGTMVSGAAYLLWQGLAYFSDHLKMTLGRLFH